MKLSSKISVQTTFVAPKKPSIETFLVIKVTISYDNFIAIDPMKKFGARFSFSDLHEQTLSRQQEPGLTLPDLSLLVPTTLSKGGGGEGVGGPQ